MRPLVAVAGMPSPHIDGLRFSGVVAAEKVLHCVRRAGGEPVILPPSPGVWTAERLTSTFAALVVPGGRDMVPETYGAEPGERTERGYLVHDQADISLLFAAIEGRLPTLAICRGMQVLNVALGGSLVQDLPDRGVRHLDAFHPVQLEPGCLVARVMGQERVDVSSYHHQGIDRVGEGLRVVGRTDDGCAEALEHAEAPLLAVQWHPEDDAEVQPYEQALFDALLEPARMMPPQAVS